MKVLKALLATALVTGVAAFAAEPRTEHTYALEDGEKRPTATLEDASFLVGTWTGTAFRRANGGVLERADRWLDGRNLQVIQRRRACHV